MIAQVATLLAKCSIFKYVLCFVSWFVTQICSVVHQKIAAPSVHAAAPSGCSRKKVVLPVRTRFRKANTNGQRSRCGVPGLFCQDDWLSQCGRCDKWLAVPVWRGGALFVWLSQCSSVLLSNWLLQCGPIVPSVGRPSVDLVLPRDANSFGHTIIKQTRSHTWAAHIWHTNVQIWTSSHLAQLCPYGNHSPGAAPARRHPLSGTAATTAAAATLVQPTK